MDAGALESAATRLDRIPADAPALEYSPFAIETKALRGRLLRRQTRYGDAEPVLRDAVALALEHELLDVAAAAATDLAYVVGFSFNRHAEGHALIDVALALARAQDRAGPLEWAALTHRGYVLEAEAKFDEAEAMHRQSLALVQARHGVDHPLALAVRGDVANMLQNTGRHDEAIAEHRDVLARRIAMLGREHPSVGTSYNNLGIALYLRDDFAGSEAAHREGLAVRLTTLGPDSLHVAASRNNLANALTRQGRFDEAVVLHGEALAQREAALGPDHALVAMSALNLGDTLQRIGRYDEAIAHSRRGFEIRQRTLAPDHPHIDDARTNLTGALASAGRVEEAETLCRETLAARQRRDGAEALSVATSRVHLGELLQMRGALDEARSEIEQAAAIASQHSGPVAEGVLLDAEFVRAALEAARGDRRAARASYEKALASASLVDAAQRSHVLWGLAQLVEDDDPERARELARGALELLQPTQVAARTPIEAWLADRGVRLPPPTSSSTLQSSAAPGR
jgi:tetratricopeptide (TPR) repeat protein